MRSRRVAGMTCSYRHGVDHHVVVRPSGASLFVQVEHVVGYGLLCGRCRFYRRSRCRHDQGALVHPRGRVPAAGTQCGFVPSHGSDQFASSWRRSSRRRSSKWSVVVGRGLVCGRCRWYRHPSCRHGLGDPARPRGGIAHRMASHRLTGLTCSRSKRPGPGSLEVDLPL